MENPLENLQYPVGRFKMPDEVTTQELLDGQSTISRFPEEMIAALGQLSEKQLDTPYRPGGWTARQVIHHCADSHMNAMVRFKLALTEDNPQIKSYKEAAWAELSDYRLDPAVSIGMLDGIHKRWIHFMESMAAQDWKRTFVHPEFPRPMRLDQLLMLYDWHCRHHLAHVLSVV